MRIEVLRRAHEELNTSPNARGLREEFLNKVVGGVIAEKPSILYPEEIVAFLDKIKSYGGHDFLDSFCFGITANHGIHKRGSWMDNSYKGIERTYGLDVLQEFGGIPKDLFKYVHDGARFYEMKIQLAKALQPNEGDFKRYCDKSMYPNDEQWNSEFYISDRAREINKLGDEERTEALRGLGLIPQEPDRLITSRLAALKELISNDEAVVLEKSLEERFPQQAQVLQGLKKLQALLSAEQSERLEQVKPIIKESIPFQDQVRIIDSFITKHFSEPTIRLDDYQGKIGSILSHFATQDNVEGSIKFLKELKSKTDLRSKITFINDVYNQPDLFTQENLATN